MKSALCCLVAIGGTGRVQFPDRTDPKKGYYAQIEEGHALFCKLSSITGAKSNSNSCILPLIFCISKGQSPIHHSIASIYKKGEICHIECSGALTGHAIPKMNIDKFANQWKRAVLTFKSTKFSYRKMLQAMGSTNDEQQESDWHLLDDMEKPHSSLVSIIYNLIPTANVRGLLEPTDSANVNSYEDLTDSEDSEGSSYEDSHSEDSDSDSDQEEEQEKDETGPQEQIDEDDFMTEDTCTIELPPEDTVPSQTGNAIFVCKFELITVVPW